jgi:hypothetical protein
MWYDDDLEPDDWSCTEASGSDSNVGCRTQRGPTPLWRTTLALRVLADATVQIRIVRYPGEFYEQDPDNEEGCSCRYCKLPLGTKEDCHHHEGRCLEALVTRHKAQPAETRAGRRRRGRRGNKEKTGPQVDPGRRTVKTPDETQSPRGKMSAFTAPRTPTGRSTQAIPPPPPLIPNLGSTPCPSDDSIDYDSCMNSGSESGLSYLGS